MSASEFLVQLDRFGLTAAGWIATWFLHSLVLCALALLIGRVLRTGTYREQLCKVALLGAFVTTAAQAVGVGVGNPFPLQLESSSGTGRPIAVAGMIPESELPEIGEPRLASASVLGVVPAPLACWRWAHALPIAALLIALAGGARLLSERRRLTRVLTGRRAVRGAGWRDDLQALSRRAGLARAPRLTSSDSLGSPIALAHGELVVPARALDELDRDARRALLAHELAHLARRDPRWIRATVLLCHVFALQPLQLLVRRRLIDEMELACDARAVAWTGGGLPLARCLEAVASWIMPEPAPALVASMATRPSALLRRVEHALSPARTPVPAGRRRIFGLGLASMLMVLACAGPRVEPAPAEQPVQDAEKTIAAMIEVPGATPTLDIESDGRIQADGKLIYDPVANDFTALDAHLAKLVAKMETRPIDPGYPDGHLMAMDELILHAAPEAPARSLLKAMEHCASAGIWRLRMTGEWPGGEVGIEVPLPVDLGTEILAAIEEEEDVAAAYAEATDAKLVRKVGVTMRVIVEGRKLDSLNGGPWNGKPGTRFVYDDSRRIEYSVGPVKTRDLQVVRDQLESILEEWPDAHATIDTRRGTVYEDVVELLDLMMDVGFNQVTFVGSYE